jgi:hypothetical protein
MFSRTTFVISAFAAAIAASFWSSGWAVAGESRWQQEGDARYRPIQSISHEFGSKSMSGYFVQQNSVCLVTLMIAERSDPDSPSPLTATRVRLMLDPGQIAGLDSEEGRSLDFTCGDGAKTLVVNYGERSKLVAQQDLAVLRGVPTRLRRRAERINPTALAGRVTGSIIAAHLRLFA